MPGEPRLFTPALVFRVGQSDPLYVNGWCHHRKAHRTLRLDQITLEIANSLVKTTMSGMALKKTSF
ncbi:MAG: hypothetical protein NTY98_02565 [Verrucomicrobia bacterium]|nr:hypothetical protein [Verrucomicrobiota bacterium]